MLGNGRLEGFCFDGVTRLCHIRGKLRKRVWIQQVPRRAQGVAPPGDAGEGPRRTREDEGGGHPGRAREGRARAHLRARGVASRLSAPPAPALQGDIVLLGLRDFQDQKADIILRYDNDEARSLKAYGELPDSVQINIDIADDEGGLDDDAFDFEEI